MVEVAGSADGPGGADMAQRIGIVDRELAVPTAEPVADRPVIAAPEDVGEAVAVEIADADDVPTGWNHFIHA
jgi:hypothetical protein